MKRSIQFFKHKAYEFRGPLLSGVFVGTTFIPFPPWALLFCYVPLWIFATQDNISVRKALTAGWITQFILTLIGFHWIAYTAHEFGNLPWVISIAALLLFAAGMHLYVAAAVGLGVFLRRKFSLSAPLTLVVFALLHSLFERIWPVIFDWNLGYTLLWSRLPLFQLADVVGFLGLSGLLLLFNAWIACIWLNKKERTKALTHLCLLVACFASLLTWGVFHGKKWNHFDREVKVTAIQGNIGNLEKAAAERGRGFQESITQTYLNLTSQAKERFPDTDVFVWPETAFPDYLDSHFKYRQPPQLLLNNLANLGTPLIVGAYSKDANTDMRLDQSTYNALFLLDGQGQLLTKPYRKTELLAFGEYLPLSERFPFILKWLPVVSNFGRGPGPSLLEMPHGNEPLRWGAQICYEGLYPEFSRGLGKIGADIVVNVTNDSWFGKTFEPYQHLYMTLARAIEIRRPLVRSTNTGITTAILANGEVLEKSPLFQEWFGQFNIKYKHNAPSTFYVRFGHFDWMLFLIALITLLATGARHARPRRP